jgi:hypothetical protein
VNHRWLRLIHRVPLVQSPGDVDPVIDETRQLIKIFFVSIRTAEKNREWHPRRKRPRSSGDPKPW